MPRDNISLSEAEGSVRQGANRASFLGSSRLSSRWVVAGITIAVVVIGVATRAHTLTEFDSNGLANGLRHYDVVTSGPAPPGYPLVVVAAHMLTWLGEPVNAYVGVAVICTALSIPVTFLLGRDMFGPSAGVAAAAMVAASPIVLYYAGIVAVYPGELLSTVTIALAAYHTAHRDSDWAPLLLFPALALGGGFRPTLLALMLPTCLVAVALGRPRLRILVAGLVIAGGIVLAWGIPMVVKSQGWAAYEHVTSSLWRSEAETTSVFYGASLKAAIKGAATVIVAALCALLPGAVLVAINMLHPAWRVLRSQAGLILAAWVLPYAFVYLLIAWGKPGYSEAIIPPFALVAAALASSTRRLAAQAIAVAVVFAICYVALPVLPLPWRLPEFIPTADNIRTQDHEALALKRDAPTCPARTCTIVSLPPSKKLWFNDPLSVVEYAGGDRMFSLKQFVDHPRSGSALWIGSLVPAGVANEASFEDRVGIWSFYRSGPAATARVVAAVRSDGPRPKSG